MTFDGQPMELGNLTPAERATYAEITRQPAYSFLSYSWLKACTENLEGHPGFPKNERLLTRALAGLKEFNLVKRIPSPDNSAWYWPAERWGLLTEESQHELISPGYRARSVRGSVTLLLAGPEVFKNDARRRVFPPPPLPKTQALSPSWEVRPRQHRDIRLKHPIAMPESFRSVLTGGIRFVVLTFGPSAVP